jgi:hypothetical protein
MHALAGDHADNPRDHPLIVLVGPLGDATPAGREPLLAERVEHDLRARGAALLAERGKQRVGLVLRFALRLLARESDRLDLHRRRRALIVGDCDRRQTRAPAMTPVGAMHVVGIAEHVIELYAHVFAVLNRGVATAAAMLK